MKAVCRNCGTSVTLEHKKCPSCNQLNPLGVGEDLKKMQPGLCKEYDEARSHHAEELLRQQGRDREEGSDAPQL